jgi:hypothetical protein
MHNVIGLLATVFLVAILIFTAASLLIPSFYPKVRRHLRPAQTELANERPSREQRLAMGIILVIAVVSLWEQAHC